FSRDWSSDVCSSDLMYYREPREPDDRERELIQSAASLAGIAIELTRTRRELLETVERFQFVARATNDVVWDWDLVADTIWWSEEIGRASGRERGEGA